MKYVKKDKLPEFFQALQNDFQVFAPVKIGKSIAFDLYGDGSQLAMDKNTDVSPKGIFFPPAEKIYGFQTKGQSVTIEEVTLKVNKKIIFGVRSCDTRGIELLDRVLLTRGFEDEFYKNRRAETLIFSLACNKPKDTCFCQSMGIDPQSAKGADIQIYDDGINYIFDGQTSRGAEFIKVHNVLFSDIEDFKPTPFKQELAVDMDGISEKMEGMFDDQMWKKLARSCIGCSTCAYLCPTCYCFDITSKRHGEAGANYRTWDCCMFDDYSLMAGGHNPRPNQTPRVRNRMMDKLVYNKKRHGDVFCVGCGRCIAKCPVNIDITAVIDKVRGANNE